MLKRHKDVLRGVVTELRHNLAGFANGSGAWQRGDLDRELERLGFAPDGTITPLDALVKPSDAERRAWDVANAQLASLDQVGRVAAREDLVERAAYSWINRLLALRVMEARSLIDETLRGNPDYDGIPEALYVLRQAAPSRTTGPDGGWWAVIEDSCEARAATLPGMFDPRDPVIALRPSTSALLRCVDLVGNAPSGFEPKEADAAFADPDAIGWAYQFYQGEAKARVDASVKRGGKVESRAEIAAKTQLFTEPYMVQWLLQNSLGRSYHEAYPDSNLPESWAYFVRLPDCERNRQSPGGSLHELTVMDPCMGSGHFLREAFDMLAGMYREREPALTARQISDLILSHHLYGIDIDPRAAQLAALTLYLRASELVNGERRRQRRASAMAYKPPLMHLATTPSGLRAGALDRHLRRHPEDRAFKPLLEGVFKALEQADILGSLLRPGEQLDDAIDELRNPHTVEMDFDRDDAELRRTITELANRDLHELKRMLLDRVAASFASDVGSSDVACDLFGREAERGVQLLQLLDRKYAVVVTNPPYLGSGTMPPPLRRYTELQFPAGRRDLYTVFILRCLTLAGDSGRVGMVTLHTFLTFTSSVDLRKTLLEQASIDQFVHLGTGTMKALSNPNAQGFCMYVLRKLPKALIADSEGTFVRLVDLRDKEEGIRAIVRHPLAYQGRLFVRRMGTFLSLPECQIIYSLGTRLIDKLAGPSTLGSIAAVPKGLTTSDNDRFLRYTWETVGARSWLPYAKGGGYRKWFGLQLYCVRWGSEGEFIKSSPNAVIRNERFYRTKGLTYTEVANGSFGVRLLDDTELFDSKSPSIFPEATERYSVLGLLNSRICTFFFRCLSPALLMDQAYAPRVPVPERPFPDELGSLAAAACELKEALSEYEPQERVFNHASLAPDSYARRSLLEAMLHTIEGRVEDVAFFNYRIGDEDREQILGETGRPAGWWPVLAGCVAPLPVGVLRGLSRRTLDILAELQSAVMNGPVREDCPAEVKRRMRTLVEAGLAVASSDSDDRGSTSGNRSDDEHIEARAHMPVPAETVVERLSTELELHPLTIYRLLEQLRADGARCKTEEQRLLEDRLSVLVLRLLGHRWPKQVEACEPVPEWADDDGVIPLNQGAGERTLAERLRAQVRTDEGDLGAQRAEALLVELTGQDLDEWLRRQFFPYHVRQFKYRPIAWHLASTPQAGTGTRRNGAKRSPAFECLIYYHAIGGDMLARIRTLYVEPLLLTEHRRLDEAHRTGDEIAAALAADRIGELEAFAVTLRQIDEEGFACPDLDGLIGSEPLDRWSGDGYLPPASRDELLRSERAWRVDINDGVRVNIAPLQVAGVVASDVLKAIDAKKAIADRARWRADERRWVREGKLPRCGWMKDDVPESQRWTELAPQRAAEQQKLQEKRRAATERLL